MRSASLADAQVAEVAGRPVCGGPRCPRSNVSEAVLQRERASPKARYSTRRAGCWHQISFFGQRGAIWPIKLIRRFPNELNTQCRTLW